MNASQRAASGSVTLVAGQTTAVPDGPWVVSVPGPYDVSALVLGADDRVAGDGDLVFWNQPTAPGVRLTASQLRVDPRSLRGGARRVLVLVSSTDAVTALGRLPAPALALADVDGRVVARFTATGLGRETVLQVAELYRHGPGWKLRALGAGYADGLAGLARDFGVDVDEEPAQRPAPEDPAGVRVAVVALSNRERSGRGLAALAPEPRLGAAAQAHNDDMVARGFFAHEAPDGSSVADRVRLAGYPYSLVAENIAAGQRTPEEVVQGWMDSPGHRANLLHPDVREIGVGFTEGGELGTMWTQVFGRQQERAGLTPGR